MFEEKDKQGHAIAGAIAGISVYLPAALIALKTDNIPLWGMAACIASIVFVALLGWAKEYMDSKDPDNHTVDTMDFVATLLGGVVGVTLVNIVVGLALWAT